MSKEWLSEKSPKTSLRPVQVVLPTGEPMTVWRPCSKRVRVFKAVAGTLTPERAPYWVARCACGWQLGKLNLNAACNVGTAHLEGKL